jgi:hypothetical protein
MKLSTFIESDSFQIGVIADAPTPAWTAKSLEKGVAASKKGLLIATYPDLEYRKRSIAVTAMDEDDSLTESETKNYHLIGSFTLNSSHRTLDVGCIPTICDGTSGRLKFNENKITVQVYGDSVFEPKKLILRFPTAKIINVWALRSALH